MSIQLVLLKPKMLLKSFQNKIELFGIYCIYCKDGTGNRTKRFTTARSLYYHLKEFHKDEKGIDHVMCILQQISYARQLGMIK